MIQAIIRYADGTDKGRYSVVTVADLEAQIDHEAGETYEIEVVTPNDPQGPVA
ncbi:MAG: hypothetical protein QHC67_01225 [Sphingobium sp.]|uniref:hypothetical protein n=1 Tax=Sphingobium sp. TaxID=1912891 RepID=UPI0029A0CB9D|nr:hypothetical protein [Sphingobium sp.]MDX3908429.1 hypothetical protein [Sphingobium sp.]